MIGSERAGTKHKEGWTIAEVKINGNGHSL